MTRLSAYPAIVLLLAAVGGAALAGESAGSVGPATTQPASTAPAAAATTQPVVVPPGMMLLKIELPKPAFPGTPTVIPPGTTVEKITGPPRPIIVPEGVVNLALHKPVASSDKDPIVGSVELVTDGNKDAKEGCFVELAPSITEPQYVQIDLGGPCEIFAVVFWHNHKDARVFHDVVVQTADDADFIGNVQTLFNNDQDNSSGLGIGRDREYFETNHGKAVQADGVKGRYVRLYSKGSTASEMNQYTEVEVYGRAVK